MKTFNKILVFALAGAMLAGVASCVAEAPEYTPAPVPTTAEVYFQDGLAASYTLSAGASAFAIPVNRANTNGSFTATVSSEADPLFSVPGTVTFADGMATAQLVIGYNSAKLAEQFPYQFNLSVSGADASQYGLNSYSFTATLPPQGGGSDWKAVGKAASGGVPTFVENIMKIYNSGIDTHTFPAYVEQYQDKKIYRIVNPMSTVTVGKTKYANPYYDESGSADGIWPEEFLDDSDYYIVLDMEGDIFKEEFGGTLEPGQVYVADSNLNFQWVDAGPFAINSAITWPGHVNYDCPRPLGNWDEKKQAINFGDFMLLAGTSIYGWPTYSGVPDTYLYFDSTLMVEDYNTYNYGTAPFVMGKVTSNIFAEEGEPIEWNANLMVNADNEDLPVYFIPDYFTDGYGLAFSAPAPDDLKDGDAISDVENEQETGLDVFGNPVFVNIKKGTVSIDADGFPIFDIQVNVYAKDADGNVAYDFGTFAEQFAGNEWPEIYSLNDLVRADKEDFYGTYARKVNDYYGADGAVVEEGTIVISDGGSEVDEETEEEVEYVAIRGISGANFDDTILAEWSNGLLFVEAQQAAGQFAGYDITVVPFSSSAFNINSNYLLIGGLTADGTFALVPHPQIPDYDGLYFYVPGVGGLSIVWNIIGHPVDDTDAAFAPNVMEKKGNATFRPFEKIHHVRTFSGQSGAKNEDFRPTSAPAPIAVR